MEGKLDGSTRFVSGREKLQFIYTLVTKCRRILQHSYDTLKTQEVMCTKKGFLECTRLIVVCENARHLIRCYEGGIKCEIKAFGSHHSDNYINYR